MKKDYFTGINSDGIAFDSMSIKYTKAFIPVMIEVWEHRANQKSL